MQTMMMTERTTMERTRRRAEGKTAMYQHLKSLNVRPVQPIAGNVDMNIPVWVVNGIITHKITWKNVATLYSEITSFKSHLYCKEFC